jgi:hypothetical protein
VNLDTLVRVYREGRALELCATLQCTSKDTPLSAHMWFTATVLALSISRGQDNCLNELALIDTHTGPKIKTRCIATLGSSRVERSFCLNDVGEAPKRRQRLTIVKVGALEECRIARSMIEVEGKNVSQASVGLPRGGSEG